MLNDILPSLIMVTIVAIFLFLICETTISFVFYFTGFLLVLTLVNLWYLSSSRRQVPNVQFECGETLMSKFDRANQLMVTDE